MEYVIIFASSLPARCYSLVSSSTLSIRILAGLGFLFSQV